MGIVYPWMSPHANDPALTDKDWYLNPTFFLVRAAIYFLVWIFLAWFMQKSALKQEETKNFRLEEVRMSWAAPGFIAVFLTGTFAFIDWVMSMEPHWYSSMYPVISLVSCGVGALALIVLIICLNADKLPYASIMSQKLTNDMGNMLFTLTMLWGYTNVTQYIIMWNGNIPELASYFAHRQSNWWNFIGLSLIIGQFFIPFFALMAPRVKKTPARLAKIAAFMFVMHIVDVYQLVVPAVPFRPQDTRWTYSPVPMWTDVVAFITVGAVWVLVFSLQSRKAPLLPAYDNRLQEAISHAH
jgi:uncharacterized membrane protein YdcZ (DUF606 family)